MSDIVWLASYPKSGNTWMRVFLANLMAGRGVDINAISSSESASARELFDAAAGVESSDLTQDEIENYRPKVFRRMASQARSRLFIKAHAAFSLTPQGAPFFPADASLGALYLLRNPLDVAASYAHHSGMSLERTIDFMANEGAQSESDENRLTEQLPMRLISWSSHVLSWTDQSDIPVHVIRYEDLSLSPHDVFTKAAAFAGIVASAEEVAAAVERSSFDKLRSQELASGFRERALPDQPFFRVGKVGSWRSALSESQVERIVERHGAVMRRFGYLGPDGRLTV